MGPRLSKRTWGIIILVLVVAFYSVGTGFPFFFKFLYGLLLLIAMGLAWAWINLRGIEVQLTRTSTRGQVGENMEGRIRIINQNRLPKSWLEVVEYSDLPGYTAGRGVALVRNQSRTWRTETNLYRRGVYHVGQVEITSQDPMGLFRLRRRFLEPQPFIVLPATVPLPDLDPRFANLPSDSARTRHVDQITTDVSSLRNYVPGDSFRRIHWPYTARMNTLMVKEFDLGISADAWVVLDMHWGAHVPSDDLTNNTEELSVTIAASLISRMVELSMPVGLGANAAQNHIYRPDSSPEHLGRLMEALAEARAVGAISLERFIYDLRPNLSRFNTLTVVTPSARSEWVPALSRLKRQGVNVGVVLVDPESFGGPDSIQYTAEFLMSNEIPTYVVRQGQSLNEALRFPLGGPQPLEALVQRTSASRASP
ncbi:MAG: DUF58 domain-containing protein [Chloroflexi bacterium]|nr:DUF58 domain-containing protein [Chloroflexota bacterium]MCI0858315.1 DUF58 domain-containing protein [Chloroflexota bacterium]MCI0877373.1 DUF58 domain-containing protein [Chloroflexota bacterium]